MSNIPSHFGPKEHILKFDSILSHTHKMWGVVAIPSDKVSGLLRFFLSILREGNTKGLNVVLLKPAITGLVLLSFANFSSINICIRNYYILLTWLNDSGANCGVQPDTSKKYHTHYYLRFFFPLPFSALYFSPILRMLLCVYRSRSIPINNKLAYSLFYIKESNLILIERI